jgi:hypothetical protein
MAGFSLVLLPKNLTTWLRSEGRLMTRNRSTLLALAALAASASAVRRVDAAFVVETRTGGKAVANLSFGGDTTTPSTSTASSAAVGTTAGIGSIFGGNGTQADAYVFTYRPGVDVDNTTFAAGAVLGSTTNFPGQGNLATGLTGGGSGLYNVYFTTPDSANVANPSSDFLISGAGAPVSLNDVNLNNGGTGADTDPGMAFVGGANNAWFKLGTVFLNGGGTYSVTQTSNGTAFVSQRASAVMWEFAGVPEPSSMALSCMGLGAMMNRRRRGV